MHTPSNLIVGVLIGAALPASGAEPPIAAPGYLQDSSGHVVMGTDRSCWHSGDWNPNHAVVVGCDGVLAKAVPIPPDVSKTEATPPMSPSTVVEAAAVAQETAGPARITLVTESYFDFDKADLKSDQQQKLEGMVMRLNGMQLEVVVAVGHADATGSARYNENLSRRRAAAVKRFLENRGVPSDRIHTDGRGETQPLVSNATREGRAKNRRVEVEVVAKKVPD